MKKPSIVVHAMLLFALGWFASPAWSADAVLHPAHITGTVHFGNSNPEIVSRLSGARTALFSGSSTAPPLSIEAREDIPAGSPDFTYNLTVEGAPHGASAGYVYSFGLNLLASQQYMLHWATASPLLQDQTATVDFSDSPGMLDIRFVTSPGGSPASVTKASYFASDAGAGSAHAIAYSVPGTGYQLLVHSGMALRLQVGYSRGTDPMLDLINYYADVNITTALAPDEMRVVEIVVPADAAKGNITGIVDMLRETEEPQDGPGYARNTVMAADGAPSGDDFAQYGRYAFLNRTPASGPFVLANLLASEDFGPIFGTVPYRVYGRMQFRSGHARNCFRIPSLLGASRPLVPRGGSVDLGNLFVLDPGYVNGRIVLLGPSESGGFRSPLRHVRTGSDMGSPAWLLGLHTSVEGRGTSEVAAGATESTYEGVGLAEVDGSFDGTDSFVGNYSLVLAGLKGQAGIWDLSRFNLYFNSVGSGDPYVVGKLLITDRWPSQVTVHPSEHVTRDLRLCFGTVSVNFSAPVGTTFFRPAVSVRGHFGGADDVGNPVDYEVETGNGQELGAGVPRPFLGEPTTAATAARTGTVRLALPRGDYTLTPSVQVVAADGSVTTLTLPPMIYTALCQGEGSIDACLQVNLSTPPTCASAPSVRITGSVASCTNVTRIVWDQGDNIEHVICEGCGMNPGFAFDFPVSGSCQDYAVRVTANDFEGRTASQTVIIPADRIAPTIACPTNMTITCASPNGAQVNYPGTVAVDNCDPSPAVTCTPASGTWFLPGETQVICRTSDRCGNSNQCTFTVTVTTNCPPPMDCLEIRCPTNVIAYACGPNCVPVVFSVWATNHCDPSNFVVVTDRPSGGCFFPGTAWVNATVFGSGQSKQCSFPVTVLPDPNCGGGDCSTNLLVNGSFENPGVPDGYIALPGGPAPGDCNHNGVSDALDIATGISGDRNFNAIPDECEMDLSLPTPTSGATMIRGWMTVLNGVEYYNPAAAPSFVNTGAAADGVYLLDLAPANGVGGGIRQTFTSVPGRSYRVSFAMGTSKERGRNGTASLTVTVAGTARAFNVSTGNPGITWERKEFSFVAASSSTTMVFSTMDDPALSFVNLDDVRVSDCCTDPGLRIRPTVTVEWNCGILQSAPEVSGPFTDVPGATSPYTAEATGLQKFFRTR